MRIRLIAPRMSLRPVDSEFKRRMAPPLSLLTVAALTPASHHVELCDENVQRVDPEAQADLVGITVNVDTSTRAYELAKAFRSRRIPVVLGGIHVSANPEEAMRHADAVCVGEAEGVWREILHDARTGRLKGIYRSPRAAAGINTPPPRWDLIDPSAYLVTNVVCASRGCPHHCEFCYNSSAYASHTFSPRPMKSILADIAGLNSRQVLFIDDNLIGNLEWAWRLVRTLRDLDITWHGAVSANVGEHPDLLDMMRESGCRSLFIGFESVNGASLRDAHKHQNRVERYEALIDALHGRGIMVNASLVFGFDHDGPDVFERTVKWLTVNRVESMTAHILTPYPGTALFARFQKEGRIFDYSWEHYNTARVVFTPKRMTRDELQCGYLRAYRDFYSFSSILRRIPADDSNWMPYFLFNLGYRKFGKLAAPLAQRLGGFHAAASLGRRMSYAIA